MIGVGPGAALGAVIAVVLGASGRWVVMAAACLGGWGAVILLTRIAQNGGRTKIARLLMAEIALSALAGAVTGLLVTMASDSQLRDLSYWSMGSLGGYPAESRVGRPDNPAGCAVRTASGEGAEAGMTLDISALTPRRGTRPVLHDLTLTLHPGAVTVVIGPNGSGTSTLLAALSGALPYQGLIRMHGVEVRGTPPETLASRRALMSQQVEVSFNFTMAEIVAMGARTPLGPARIAALLAEVGLVGFGARNAVELSGGEAQRMHLARALAQAETGTAPF